LLFLHSLAHELQLQELGNWSYGLKAEHEGQQQEASFSNNWNSNVGCASE
jgi:hypothetical protein